MIRIRIVINQVRKEKKKTEQRARNKGRKNVKLCDRTVIFIMFIQRAIRDGELKIMYAREGN